MATTASPYGLRAVNRNDGMPYAGATSQFLINPAGTGTNLFFGQVVIIDANGYIALSTATGADLTTNNLGGNTLGAWGVFVGCSYINAQGQQIYGQYYPSGTTGVVTAYVITDPNVTFQAQLDGTTTQAAIGANTFFAAVLRYDWAGERGSCHDDFLTCDKAYLSACRQPGLSDTPENPGMNSIYTKRKRGTRPLFRFYQVEPEEPHIPNGSDQPNE